MKAESLCCSPKNALSLRGRGGGGGGGLVLSC